MGQVAGSNLVHVGIDLSEFYLSVEWDILEVPATRNEEFYPCCKEPFSGIILDLNYLRFHFEYKYTFQNIPMLIPITKIFQISHSN